MRYGLLLKLGEKNLFSRNYDINQSSKGLIKLYKNQENIKFVLDALYGATNEPMGTSYGSRLI